MSDMDKSREIFENWLTGNGNYNHLKHKSFGGNYLHEESAMKWDGFKFAWNTRADLEARLAEARESAVG